MKFNSLIRNKDVEPALEVAITHQLKEEYTLRDKYFPYVESFLPKTEHILFKHIAKYEDMHVSVINSPYPTNVLPFKMKGEDNDIVFRCCHINEKELQKDIKSVPLPPGVKKEKAAFLPLQVLLYFIIRYYLITGQQKKAFIIYYYYGYSLYWKRWSKSFSRGIYNPSIMIYTINEMSYRSLIKKLGSVKELLFHIVKNRFEYYSEQLADSCDEDIRYVLDQIQSSLGSIINEIASKFYKNAENQNVIMQSNIMLDDQGTQRDDDASITASVESLAQKYTNVFFMSNVDPTRVKQASTLAKEVSTKEVLSTIEYVYNNTPAEEIHEFYSSLFFIYFNLDNPKASLDAVNSLLFLALMRDVIKKGNSTNKNIIKIRSLMDNWLNHGSNTFRVTSREGTQNSYRKAVYYYFILSVTNNK